MPATARPATLDWQHARAYYAPNQSQCHVRLPFPDLGDARWRLQDALGDATYDWAGSDLTGRGLFLDMVPWQAQVFPLQLVA
jgi:hypothetical protein